VLHRTTAYTTFFPLTFDSFNDYVLRPEVGVRLLMEDFKCAWEEALEIWSASGTYGELQFPYRDDDPIVGQLHNALNSIN
jgi:RTC4-like domain